MRALFAFCAVLLLLGMASASGFPVFQSGSGVIQQPVGSQQAASAGAATSRMDSAITRAVQDYVYRQMGELAEVERLMYQGAGVLKGTTLSVAGTIRTAGHSVLEVSDQYGNALQVRAVINHMVEAYVPVRNITRGEVLREGDFRRQLFPATQARNAMDIGETDFASHIVSTRNLQEGQIVRTTDLRREYAVQRGDIVEVIYRHDRLTLSMAAVATERAYLGDVVRLKNPSSGRILTARLLQGKKAEIIY